MMTEDELKRFEQTAGDDYEMEDHGNMEMRELIAEVRRLNAAYRHILSIFKLVPELAPAWLSTFLAFEPEECGKWMGELARASDDLDKMKKG